MNRKLTILGLLLSLLAACTTPNPNSKLANKTLEPYQLNQPKIEPNFCYALKQTEFGDRVYLRTVANDILEVDLIGSRPSGIAVYTHDQYQYQGDDGKTKIAIKVTVKESTPFKKRQEVFGKTGMIAFDYSSSKGILSTQKIADLEQAAYSRFIKSKVDSARCKQNKAAECSLCGDASNPNFDSCIAKNKALKCPEYQEGWVQGVCQSDCGSLFNQDSPKHFRCIERKFQVKATYVFESCGNFAKYTCGFPCSRMADSHARLQCYSAQRAHCKK